MKKKKIKKSNINFFFTPVKSVVFVTVPPIKLL